MKPVLTADEYRRIDKAFQGDLTWPCKELGTPWLWLPPWAGAGYRKRRRREPIWRIRLTGSAVVSVADTFPHLRPALYMGLGLVEPPIDAVQRLIDAPTVFGQTRLGVSIPTYPSEGLKRSWTMHTPNPIWMSAWLTRRRGFTRHRTGSTPQAGEPPAPRSATR